VECDAMRETDDYVVKASHLAPGCVEIQTSQDGALVSGHRELKKNEL
jgi:hypothetical protein